MTGSVSDDVIDQIEHARNRYYRLVLVVGRTGKGKTVALREVAARTGAPLVNVNLELSCRLLDLSERRRPLRINDALGRILAESGSEIVLLDNTEILFEPALKQDPLHLLQGASRNRTVVAAWNGAIDGGHLHYAEPGHREHRKHPADGLLALNAERGK